jgi:hypothetical protein
MAEPGNRSLALEFRFRDSEMSGRKEKFERSGD